MDRSTILRRHEASGRYARISIHAVCHLRFFQLFLRLFSGRLADKTRAYWTIAIFGYAINIVVVPALAVVAAYLQAVSKSAGKLNPAA